MRWDTSKALQSLWDGLATVYTKDATVNPDNKRTEFTEIELYTDIPCRLSFESAASVASASASGHVTAISQSVKLFLAPDTVIPPGSKIAVTQNGTFCEYQQSGEPAMHSNHQEIRLELWDRWA